MGLIVSSTVTVPEQVRTFPEASVAVRVTVLLPRLAQEKEVWLSDRVGVPQLSVEPLLNCAVVRLAVPLPLK